MIRDKIEEIVSRTQPRIRFQLTMLEKVEDWIAYISNLQTLGFKVSATYRLYWGGRLCYIIDGTTPNVRIMIRVKDKDEQYLAEYYIQNVIRHQLRDKAFDEFLKEIMRWLA
jgi:phosphomannomutase